MQWSRNELRTLAIWHFAHAYQLDDGDWTIEITPDSIECSRDAHEGTEAEEAAQVGREMMVRSFGLYEPWRGKITVRRHGDLHDPDWQP